MRIHYKSFVIDIYSNVKTNQVVQKYYIKNIFSPTRITAQSSTVNIRKLLV